MHHSNPDPRTPVVIGVGQLLHRDDDYETDPIELLALAAELAAHDTGATGLLSRLDTIAVAPIVSWRYGDPAVLLSPRISAKPRLTMYPTMGGNTPQMLMNRLGERIVDGTTDLALLCGAEAYRTRMRARRNDVTLVWQRQDLESTTPGWSDSGGFDLAHPSELARGIMLPTQAYPLFENALRHQAGRTASDQSDHIAEMWSRFSEIAAENPYAWDRNVYSPTEIATVTPHNRMVGFPYTKHMVSNPDVDMSSALVVCSVERAEALGVSRDRWVFLHSGADGADSYLSTRPSFTASPAIRVAGSAALELARCSVDDIAHLDVYSCFPSAVQIACRELDIKLGRQLTVYGGLCFAGGPWNNPVGHALATMTDVLRNDPGSLGLVTANGGNIQKHSFGVYSSNPPHGVFRTANPQLAIDAEAGPETAEADYEGAVRVETWTVMHGRDGAAARAHAAVRTADDRRGWAVTDDPDVMATMETDDMVDRSATMLADGTLQFT